MDPKTLAEQLAALSEYVPPPPPSPPKGEDQEHEEIHHDQLDENDIDDAKNQNLPQRLPLTFAQQIAVLEKQLGWDKDDDEKEINDSEALNEYLNAKKNFSNEVNDYMNQISSWRRNDNNDRHADPGFQRQIVEQQEMFESEDGEQEPERENDELNEEVIEPPTKSAAMTTKKPKSKSTSTTLKKPVVTSTKKPSSTSRSASSANAVGGIRQQKQQPTVETTPKKKQGKKSSDDVLVIPSSDASILVKKNSDNNNSKKNKDFLKNLRLASAQSSNQHHHHHQHHNNNNNSKLPPRKTPITFTELTKTVLKNQIDNSTTSSSFSVDNADALADALEQVTKIDFTNRGLTDLDAFDCLPSVTHAYLGDNHIKSLDGCEIWLDCQVLVLHDNEISSVPQLFALRNLRFLDLRRNKLFEGVCRDSAGEADTTWKQEYLTERFVSFLPETLESLEIEGNEYFIKSFIFLALDDSDDQDKQQQQQQQHEQNKEFFWYACLARCPNLSSIDVIGTRQEIDDMRNKRQQQIQESESGQEQDTSKLLLEYNTTKKNKYNNNNNDDDDEQEDDPMLHGKNNDASENNSKSNSNNRGATTMDDDFVEPMPDEATFAATLKQHMKMNSSNRNGIEETTSSESSDDDDEDIIVKFKPEGDGLQARITDADFDEDNNNNNHHHTNNNNSMSNTHDSSNDVCANRPVSARNTMNLILNSARGNRARPISARGQNNNHAVVVDNTNESEISEKQDAQADDDVRLRLPITENIQSNVRSVTDDLLRQYGNVRRNAEAAENSRANHVGETMMNNNSKNDMTALQIIDDASKNADATQDSIEELRSESRDLRRELLFAAQHQARVASLRVDDMWNEGVEEFKRELENSLTSRRNNNDNGGIFSNKNSAVVVTTTAETSKFTPKNIFGDDGDENPFLKMKRELPIKNELTAERPRSSAYESALRVLANRSHTTVEGLDKYRKPIEK